MYYFQKLGAAAIIALLICSCSSPPATEWATVVPEETSFIIVPGRNATVDSLLQSSFIPLLDDVSSSGIQLVSKIDSMAGGSLPLKSLMLYPGSNQKLQPVWVTDTGNNLLQKLEEQYTRSFAQNKYLFEDTPVLDLQIENRRLFVAQVNDLLLFSESSLGIENSIRAWRGIKPAADLGGMDIRPGSLIINTPALDRWVMQLARVRYGPAIKDALAGTRPALLRFSQSGDEQDNQLQFSGNVPLNREEESPLVSILSGGPGAITLDAYISSKAAAYGIFRAPPQKMSEISLPDTTTIDRFLLNDPEQYGELAGTMGTEFGMAMYTQSGFLSTGEHLYLRTLSRPAALRNIFDELSTRGSVQKVDGLYFVQSYLLSRLIGSSLSSFTDFYLNITGDAVVMSKRKGLAEMVASDRSRRRVITYDQSYKKIRETLSDNLSSLFVAGPEFHSFLQPFLGGNSYVQALSSPFDYIALTTAYNADSKQLGFTLSTFQGEANNEPYRENWRFSTGGAALSGVPVFGDLGGSFNEETVFATETGNVYAVATDGTLVQEYNTGRDIPVGSPVVYDWYGSGENVVLIAAGNKIYGWDKNGDMLPKFPFELDEQITTPLSIADLNENRLPDAIVATADRKLHVLNGRGNNLPGWPVTTNARIRSAPMVDYFGGQKSVIAFSSNAVHGWNATGNTFDEYPKFIDANFKGAPVIAEDHILGNAVDGRLYAIGEQPLFADSLRVSASSSNGVEAVYVTNGSLTGTPSVDELTVKKEQNSYNEPMILTTSASGSIFLLSSGGQLRLTKSMGQPGAENWSSLITDINNDGNKDIVALASYGRLYAWDVATGDRIFDLPTTGMGQLNIADLDGDGLKELIGQTEDGVQSWTINR